MKTFLTGLILLAVAAPLFAGEAERDNANAFIDQQKSINEAVLGEQKLKIRMLGVPIGTLTLKLEAGEHNGTKCYVLTMTGASDFGAKHAMSGKSYFAPDLSLLYGESTETEDGKTTLRSVYKLENDAVSVKVERPTSEVEDEREIVAELDTRPGLLLAGAELLVTMLLPREAGKTYEFTRWSDRAQDGSYPLTIEAVGKEVIDRVATFRFIESDLDFERDEQLNWVPTESKKTLWFDGHKLLRLSDGSGSELASGPDPTRTQITRETIDKREDVIATAAGFYLAAGTNDATLLKALLNEEKFVRANLEADPDSAAKTEEEKQALVKELAPNIVEKMLKGEAKAADDFAFKLLLNVENFEASEEDGKQLVSFTEEAAMIGGSLHFVLEQDAAKKWEIVAVVNGLTPRRARQVVADKMRDAAVALDADAAKALFHTDEHENFEKRIGREFRDLKAEGATVTCKRPRIEKQDGKFTAFFELTVKTKEGDQETETNKLSIIQKDGQWYLSFTK